MKIHERPSVEIAIGGRLFRMRPTVRNVIRATDVLDDMDMLPADRAALAVEVLFCRPRPKDHNTALEAAFRVINEPSPYRTRANNARALDYKQDANLIVAAFRQLYAIDLQREAARMDWRVFRALLSGVTSETQLGQIIEIRTRKIPKQSKHNAEMVREMQRLRSEYAIRTRGKLGSGFDDGMKNMASMLLEMAGGEPNGGRQGNIPNRN